MLPRDVRPEDKPVACACCGVPAETQVWQLQLCLGCSGRWKAEVKPPPCHTEWPMVTPQKERWAQWRAATADWLASTKARAA